jgi:SNF2 family DNA or RNA helicase
VTTVIPTAREFTYKGEQLVAVPHRIDETRVLRNMGIKAPSPILHHYDWPRMGGWTPFYAQYETAQFLTLNPKAFVLNAMGTGKTLSALWAFDYLKSVGLATKMLVVSPLSTMERVWADEIFRHFPHLTVCVLYGTKERRQKLLADPSFDVYIINHHGIRVIEQELVACDIDTICVDEIATFRNASTALWKSLNKIVADRPRLWGMTGTPTPNAPTDAWAQCRLVTPERVPKYFGKFRDSTMKASGPFKWVPRDGATAMVFEAMQPAVRFTRDQCIDLPPCMYVPRQVSLTKEQASAYRDMLGKLHTEFGGSTVTAMNEAIKMSKLVQIACGVVYGVGGEEIVLPTKPRVDAVLEVIEQAATKTIVFVPYKAVLRYVAEEIAKDLDPGVAVRTMVSGRWTDGKVAMISGDVPKAQRDAIFQAFQNGDIEVLVAQPDAMSHGLTLTAANTVIWYAPTTKHETYQQANARVTRPGQKQSQFIVNIEGTPVERRMYQRLQAKEAMQGLLLEAVKEAYGS